MALCQAEIQDLGLGIADAVILSLCETGRVVVRPFSAVLPHVDSEQDSLTIGSRLDVGMVLEGVITNVTRFGAFVDIGPMEGMVHISEISWGRVRHPERVKPKSTLCTQSSEGSCLGLPRI